MIGFDYKYRHFLLVFLACAVLLMIHTLGFAAKKSKDKKKTYAMTEIELQSELMSYADRFASRLIQAFEDFDALSPSPESRRFVQDDIVHIITAAYTTAAEPNPPTAMLDLVSIATLGRIIYENNHRRRYGELIEVIVQGFRELEKDIWRIAAKILSIEQQQELRGLIEEWRQRNPHMTAFSHFRFGHFAADRRKSTLVKKGQTGGMFKSVQEATQQVEESRLLAERTLYLATRLPLLTGAFSEVWLTNLLVNPELAPILSDLNRFTTVSERMANVVEDFPEQISIERDKTIEQISQEMSKLRSATIDQTMKEVEIWSDVTIKKIMEQVDVQRSAAIDQFMNRLGDERKNALEDILAEEQRIKGLVSELRLTLTEGNNLLQSASTLSTQLNLDLSKSAGQPADSEPFDIRAYQATTAEVAKTVVKLTTLVEMTNRLVGALGTEGLLPQFVKALDNVEREGEELVDYTVRQTILLIAIGMVAYIIGRLVYSYLNKRLIESRV